jgi:hypothetical protein
MGVEGGGHHRMSANPLPLPTFTTSDGPSHHSGSGSNVSGGGGGGADDSSSLGHTGINLCDAMAAAGLTAGGAMGAVSSRLSTHSEVGA